MFVQMIFVRFMIVYYVFVYVWWPEVGIGPPGARVRGGCEPPDVVLELESPN